MSEKESSELIAAFPNIDATELELSELHHGNAVYSPQVKIQTVIAYLTTGSMKEAGELAGVSHETVREWKYKAAWWQKAVVIARKSLQKELDDTYTRMLHKSTTELMDRVEKGNKKGTKRVPLSARELLDINVKIFEKRALLRGEPTSHTQKTDIKATVVSLAQELENYSKSKTAASPPVDAEFQEVGSVDMEDDWEVKRARKHVQDQLTSVPKHPKYEHESD